MGINKYLVLSRYLVEEEAFLSYLYAINAMRKGRGVFYVSVNQGYVKLNVTEVHTAKEAWNLFEGYVEKPWGSIVKGMIDFFLEEGEWNLDWVIKYQPSVSSNMFRFRFNDKWYQLPLDETYEMVLADHKYDPLQAYRKKSRGSLTGVSGLLVDLQKRLSDAQIEPSRKEAALRKVASLITEVRKLGLMKEKDDPELG